MKKIDIAYIILHYITIEDTIKCVKSIEETNCCNSYHIIIVDNASPNKTGKILKKMYENNPNISVILSEKNLGFANGNNLGYKYFKQNFTSKFLTVLNNDTILLQKNFFNLLLLKCSDKNIAAIGPKIILSDNSITPLYLKMPSYISIKKRIFKIYMMILCDFLKLHFISKYLYMAKLGKTVTKNDLANYESKNIILHGSFIIFTDLFINSFDEIFDSRTFLYCEEELLYLKLRKNNFDTLYTTDIEVIHNEILLEELRRGENIK